MPVEQENEIAWSVVPFKTSPRGPRAEGRGPWLSVEGGAPALPRRRPLISSFSRKEHRCARRVDVGRATQRDCAVPAGKCERLQTRHFQSV